jgi:hypothetical protein
MNKLKKYTKLSPDRFPKYNQGPITSAYMLVDGSIVGYCEDTREWLKWNVKNELHAHFGKTRDAAAELEDDWVANKPVEMTPADEGFAASRAEANVENVAAGRVTRFVPRYINLAAVTDDARTITSQIWAQSQDEVDGAENVLAKWIKRDQEQWHGRIVYASMFDGRTKELRQFKCYDNALHLMT